MPFALPGKTVPWGGKILPLVARIADVLPLRRGLARHLLIGR